MGGGRGVLRRCIQPNGARKGPSNVPALRQGCLGLLAPCVGRIGVCMAPFCSNMCTHTTSHVVWLCTVHCPQAGEFWWKLALEATPALPQPPISLAAPLGATTSYMLSAANPTAAEATFTSSSSSPDRFWLNPGSFKVGSQGPGHWLHGLRAWGLCLRRVQNNLRHERCTN